MGFDKHMEYSSATQTLIGTQERTLYDMDTGEEIKVQQITKRIYGSKNFWKCYLMDFLTILGILDSKQTDIFIYIMENTNQSNNLFIGTYKKISADLHVSEPTIAKIMKKLQTHNFIKRVQNGVWMVNPTIMLKGNDHKQQLLLSYFENETPIDEITKTRTKARNTTKALENQTEKQEGQEQE